MKKGIVLITVSGIMLVVTILAVVALNLMTAESRTAEHKLRRIRGYFAAQGAIVHALERLRREGTANATITAINGDHPIFTGQDPTGATQYSITTDINVVARGTGNCASTSPSPFCVSATAPY
ncbi:MAG: hypothetical protein M0R48_08135 [Candidatus Omnitrophica bacterium]|jgi:Tfp pilus assembly protein PilX|nr:hypothetical protein [Candidatus Omnitrophota bacterium]